MSRVMSHVLMAMSLITLPLIAADKGATPAAPQVAQVAVQEPFKAFTGKVTGKRVRLRNAPTLTSNTIRELNNGDMLVVVGEESDFYAVQPISGLKGYIYRTYVLDDVVEGTRVNVRLAPDLESAVVAQLNSGDRIKGVVSSSNNKWMEIELPETARFYVAKDYLEVAGGPNLYQDRLRRQSEVAELLNAAFLVSQSEMRKPYSEIELKRIERAFEPLIQQYTDFPDQVARAKESLKQIQELYTQKKVTHLEAKQLDGPNVSRAQRKELESQVKSQQERLAALESQVEQTLAQAQQAIQAAPNLTASKPVATKPKEPTTETAKGSDQPAVTKAEVAKVEAPKLAPAAAKPQTTPVAKVPAKGAQPSKATDGWSTVEESLYAAWAKNRDTASLDAFYMEEALTAEELVGVVEPYREPLRNRPGDYVLYDHYKPLGYLYSTQVDLTGLVGKRVKMRLAPRANNHFAFPAYYVLSAEPVEVAAAPSATN